MTRVKFNHSKKLNPVLMMVISGSTNAGKTHLLFNMLTTSDILDFNHLQIFTTTPEQIYYQLLKHGFDNNLSKETIQKLHDLYENDEEIELDDIPSMCKEASRSEDQKSDITVRLTNNLNEFHDPAQLNKSKKNLVIFDDCVNNKDQTVQKTFFTRGRHNSCNCIYLTQSFYGLNGSDIRKNANCFILFGMNQRALTQILQDIDVGDREEFKRISQIQWNNPNEHKYVFVNIHKPTSERISTDIF